MPGLVPFALATWAAASIAGFARWRGRDAAIVSMIVGWAFLPTLDYLPSPGLEEGIGGPVHAMAVASPLLFNKATAIALGCLAGAMLFDWPAIRRLRASWVDLPMVVFCVVPVASAAANGLPLAEGLQQARYLALSWGVPYALGRLYLGDNEGLRRLAIGLVVATLAYAPLCLLEFAFGPYLYGLAYGPHPYQWEGAARPLGSRPLVFLEHGNQLGLWLALGALAATWLWGSGRLKAVAGLPGGPVAAGLCALCVLAQSLGAILLLAAGLVLLLAVARTPIASRKALAAVRPAAVVAAGAILLLVAILGSAFAARSSGLREQVRATFSDLGKTSFTWRLARYEGMLAKASQRPVLGWGRADWSPNPDGTFVNPVNLGTWFHAFGAYGAVGLAATTAVLAAPALAVGRRIPPSSWLDPRDAGLTVAAVLLLACLGDSLVNSTIPLPLLAAAGGLNSWRLMLRRDDSPPRPRERESGHMRYRVPTAADDVPGPKLAGRPGARSALRAIAWTYTAFVVAFYAYLRWASAGEWLPHLLFYGPRWALALPLIPLLPAALRARTRWSALASAAALAGLVANSGFALPWRLAIPDAPTRPTLRVLTAHLDVGTEGRSRLSEYIRKVGPDLVCFQDSDVGAARECLGEGAWHLLGDGEFTLASRHPIRDLEVLRDPSGSSKIVATRAEVAWKGGVVFAVSVHLPSPRFALVGMAYAPIRDIPNFRKMLRTQQAKSGLLRRWVAQVRRPIFLAGDFNLTSEHPLFRQDWSTFHDAFSQAGTGFGPTLFANFDFLLGASYTLTQAVRIDHVLCGPDGKAERCEVGPDFGSEHRPVLAEFSLAAPLLGAPSGVPPAAISPTQARDGDPGGGAEP